MTQNGRAVVGTATLVGITAVPVDVEADVGQGLPCFHIVGMADAAVLEARQRVRSAIRASGYRFPNASVVVNLAPAPLRKHGTGFDLPIALAILVATRQVPAHTLKTCSVVGELSLSGQVRPVAGLLAHLRGARDGGRTLVGPLELASYTNSLEGVSIRAVASLEEIRGSSEPPRPPSCAAVDPFTYSHDMSEVVGQNLAKRALEITAAGGHNLLMVGPPGSGKSMLAQRLAGLLPPLEAEERIQTALVHGVAGINDAPALSGVRPFRAPHHSCTVAGMVGGGSPPRPGEVSLAHNGVLFLDELPQFGPAVLQSLRQPIEDGVVSLVRADGRIRYPSAFSMLAAANPCPCGFLGDSEKACTCDPGAVGRYANRIGGPLLDRIDLSVRVDRIDPGLLVESSSQESSATIALRVHSAREVAKRRSTRANSQLSGQSLLNACQLSRPARMTLTDMARKTTASGRAVTRVLRVARTIADLESSVRVTPEHIQEAFGYRVIDCAGGLG